MSTVRTRFAPSPTGFLHVGGVRTALFAWLVAKQSAGQFILRIEDTDKAREVAKAEQHIIDSLNWIGITWDEGTDIGGPYAPYRQSERLDIYRQWAQKLLNCGRAYTDPYTLEELNNFREAAKAEKRPFLFREQRPANPPAWDGSKPLRFKSEPKNYAWHDTVMGDLQSGQEAIDDFILIKADGYPTYNFCHIVDDSLMKISHVIRSQEFLSSVPKYLNLYEALGLTPPILATLPYVMAADGHKKLSKRDDAKDILDYARQGYLPETMMNFLATLGWNDGTKQEIFTKDELVSKFKLESVQKAGAHFDEHRLLWMNGHWIRNLPTADLYKRALEFWPEETSKFSNTYKKQVLGLIKDRLKYLAELPALTKPFFIEPEPDLTLISSNKQLSNLSQDKLKSILQVTFNKLSSSDFNLKNLTKLLNDLLVETNQGPNVVFSLIRLATTWTASSPNLAESLNVLGKDKTLDRIQKSINFLS